MLIDFMNDVRKKLTSEGALVAYAVLVAVAFIATAGYFATTRTDATSTVHGFCVLGGYFFLWAVVKSFTHTSEDEETSVGVRLFELGVVSLLKGGAGVAVILLAFPSPYVEGWLFWGGVAAVMFWLFFDGMTIFVYEIAAMVREKIEAVRWNQAVIRERLQQIQAESEVKRQASAQAQVEDSLLSDLADYLSEDRTEDRDK